MEKCLQGKLGQSSEIGLKLIAIIQRRDFGVLDSVVAVRVVSINQIRYIV